MFSARSKGLTAVVVSLLVCFASGNAQAARNAETPANAKQYAFAQTPAWKEHAEFMRAAWARLNDRQVAAMTAWRDTQLPRTCPAGKTLLYPFSGPDFFNAYWLFPGCETMVMFGLEHIGEVPNVEAMSERTMLLLLADVRAAMTSFLSATTSSPAVWRSSCALQLHGVLPVSCLDGAHGRDIVRIVGMVAPLPHTEALPRVSLRDLKGVTTVPPTGFATTQGALFLGR
jgi:hypothetical protein